MPHSTEFLCADNYTRLGKVTEQGDSCKILKWIMYLHLRENGHKCTTILGFQDSSKA